MAARKPRVVQQEPNVRRVPLPLGFEGMAYAHRTPSPSPHGGPFRLSLLAKDNPHSYIHLILALGIVREPTVWGFITSKYIFEEK